MEVLAWIVFGPVIGTMIGSQRGRPVFGTVLGLLLGPLGWLIAWASEDVSREPCPACREKILPDAMICPFCRTSLSEARLAAAEQAREAHEQREIEADRAAFKRAGLKYPGE